MSKGKTNSGTGGGRGKSSIIVAAPTGSVVYIENQDGKRKDTGEKNGTWTFKGCDIGTWTVYASLDDQSTTSTVEITEEGQLFRYYVTITYFAATIDTTYPEGSICTCSKGDIVLNAPDTSGSVVFTVPEAGDWVVSCTDETDTASKTVSITKKGQKESIVLTYYNAAKLKASGLGYYSEGYAGTYVRSSGRGFTRASILPAIFTWEYVGTENSGYCLIAASEEALATTSVTSYGDMTKTTIKTEHGILYIGYQKYNNNNGIPYIINENGDSIELTTSQISNCYNQPSNSISSDLMPYLEYLLLG